jgi:hypothetical protein
MFYGFVLSSLCGFKFKLVFKKIKFSSCAHQEVIDHDSFSTCDTKVNKKLPSTQISNRKPLGIRKYLN